MAKIRINEADGITKYNHNHDPATGRFATGGGSGSGGSGGVDYRGVRREMEQKLEQVRNHPARTTNPEAHKKELKRWEDRIKQLDEKYGPKGNKMTSQEFKQYESEFKQRLEELKNHPARESNPGEWKHEVSRWERRLQLLREKYGK